MQELLVSCCYWRKMCTVPELRGGDAMFRSGMECVFPFIGAGMVSILRGILFFQPANGKILFVSDQMADVVDVVYVNM
jgi:hypothetical protein